MNLSEPVLTPAALEVTYRFKAPIEQIFRAWTEPELLKQWFHASPDGQVSFVEVDLRVGGRYRIGMSNPDGEDLVVGGEYREIDPPNKLVYTWRWDHSPAEIPTTLVTLEFSEAGGGSRVRLLHEGFASEESRNNHADGWQGCVRRLYQLLGES